MTMSTFQAQSHFVKRYRKPIRLGRNVEINVRAVKRRIQVPVKYVEALSILVAMVFTLRISLAFDPLQRIL